jgi:hypothetical protein
MTHAKAEEAATQPGSRDLQFNSWTISMRDSVTTVRGNVRKGVGSTVSDVYTV